jgi:hypothetical protein
MHGCQFSSTCLALRDDLFGADGEHLLLMANEYRYEVRNRIRFI